MICFQPTLLWASIAENIFHVKNNELKKRRSLYMRTIPSANYRSLGTYLYVHFGLINSDIFSEIYWNKIIIGVLYYKKLRYELVIANGIHCVDTMRILSYDRKATTEQR